MKKLLMTFILAASIAIAGTAYAADENQSGNVERTAEGLTSSADGMDSIGNAESSVNRDGWKWSYTEDFAKVIIEGYAGPVPANGELVIPRVIWIDRWSEYYEVVRISDGAFRYTDWLKSVSIEGREDIYGGIVSIGKSAFERCGNLQKVTIPDSVVKIGESAFRSCFHLLEVKIPNSLEEIEKYTFENCHRMKHVQIAKSVKYIRERAFHNCWNLLELTIPSFLVEIEKYAFDNCHRIRGASLGVLLKRIGEGAFRDCYGMRFCSLDEHVEYIGKHAFLNCTRMKRITLFNKNVQVGHHAIGFKYRTYRDDGYPMPDFTVRGITGYNAEKYAKENGLQFKDIDESESETTVKQSGGIYKLSDSGAIYLEPEKFRETIEIPGKIKIKDNSYKVTEIAASAFKYDIILRRITIGKNVTSIGNGAFRNAKNLQTVTINSTKITSIGMNAFKGTSKKLVIRVPKKKYTAYKKMLEEAGFKGKVIKK